MAKKFLLTSLLVFSSILIYGCEKENSNPFNLDTTKNVDLVVGGNLENFEGLEAILAKFEKKYPNCSITYETMTGEPKEIVPVRLENDPTSLDMFVGTKANLTDMQKETGNVNYIDEYFYNFNDTQIDLSDLNEEVNNSTLIDDKLFIVPLAVDVRGIVVNESLLKKHNLEIPETYNEFVACCTTLVEEGYTPIQTRKNDVAQYIFYPAFAASVVQNENYEAMYNLINQCDDSITEYALDIIGKVEAFVTNGFIDYQVSDERVGSDAYEGSILNFLKGDVPFMACTATTFSGIAKRETLAPEYAANPFDYSFIVAPTTDKGGYAYISAWTGIAINRQGANTDWSMAFCDFLFKHRNIGELAKIKGLISNTVEFNDDVRFERIFDSKISTFINSSKFQIKGYSALNNTLQSLVYPKYSLDGSANKVIFNQEQAIQKYKELLAAERAKL